MSSLVGNWTRRMADEKVIIEGYDIYSTVITYSRGITFSKSMIDSKGMI